eukprot:CAMPEP_0119122850 /NCGR_PEP_ID=MMETSP1310-20130426/2985_1 /TAXON_ID=464262 /ORGANISM="Genus nov. species nov., Strain RCC2339" /LENGTH=210 /DNA_ID=CAMNT_0007112573 /DNA_START=44 /DNA_END=672 /DNA_ORIENTATION=+
MSVGSYGGAPPPLINWEEVEHTYTSCYCEENIWKLCESIEKLGTLDMQRDVAVAIISNHGQTVPFWGHNAPDDVVVWDYHVVALLRGPSRLDSRSSAWYVYDYDVKDESCPMVLAEYARKVLKKDSLVLKKEYRRNYFLLTGASFLRNFSSDRSHMRNEDGSWMAPPPTYPPIMARNPEASLSLMRILDTFRHGEAEVTTEPQFLSLYTT